MVDEGIADYVKYKPDVLDNRANSESSPYTADSSNANSKNEYLGSGKENHLQTNSCYCNLTIIDNLLKNMHNKWSIID